MPHSYCCLCCNILISRHIFASAIFWSFTNSLVWKIVCHRNHWRTFILAGIYMASGMFLYSSLIFCAYWAYIFCVYFMDSFRAIYNIVKKSSHSNKCGVFEWIPMSIYNGFPLLYVASCGMLGCYLDSESIYLEIIPVRFKEVIMSYIY